MKGDKIHVLVPHHAQRIYDPTTDREYYYTVTHELLNGWELVKKDVAGDAYEVEKKPSADMIAPATVESIYTLKLRRKIEDEDEDGDGSGSSSDNSSEAEYEKAEYEIILYTPSIHLTLHAPSMHGNLGTKMKRPTTEAADTVEGFDTGYIGIMLRNEDNDDGDAIPAPPAAAPRDNDNATPSSADDDLVALLIELNQPNGMPDELKMLLDVNLLFGKSSDSQIQVFDEDKKKVNLTDLSEAKNLTDPGIDKHLSKLINDGSAIIYLEGLGGSTDTAASRWGDEVDQVTLRLTTGEEYKEASSHGLLLPVDIVPDYNRDGVIDFKDRGKITEENPFRWWVNDDNDKNATDGRGANLDDVPGQNIDNGDAVVNGLRDLIDFFPLHLDLKEILKALPKDKYKYFIKHESAAINLIQLPSVILNGSEAGKEVNSHFTNYTRAFILSGDFVSSYPLTKTTQAVQLSDAFLDAAKESEGALIVESIKSSTDPIVLEIQKNNGDTVCEVEFPISFVPVENMYRHVNMRALKGGTGGHTSQTSEPSGYPDSLTKNEYVAYVHGYNISGEQSRGSHSNIFKRLHQLGNKARYIGVAWYGDPPNPGVNLVLPPDYHKAVFNGLETGSVLSSNLGLGFTQESGLTLLAHSLGNSVVSHAIANHYLQAEHYFMINGAMPIQAYDSSQTSNSNNDPSMERNMTEDDWKDYFDHYGQRRLFAANWHELFDPADNRSRLKWKNLFHEDALLGVAYNFYSPSDEVVENPDETEEFSDADNLWASATAGGRHAWVSQEIVKGGQSIISPMAFADLDGGWKFNYHPGLPETIWQRGYVKYSGLTGSRLYSPLEARDEISNSDLRTKPFHDPFYDLTLYDEAEGSAAADSSTLKHQLLATAIPATSYAIAVNELKIINTEQGANRNYNMPSALKTLGAPWPEHPSAENPGDWLHGDFKDVALPHIYPMYKKMIELGDLNKYE